MLRRIVVKGIVANIDPGELEMDEGPQIGDDKQRQVIAQIVELQREFYFENKNKETERRRRLRDIIDRATPQSEN
jgi:hypothetical protein